MEPRAGLPAPGDVLRDGRYRIDRKAGEAGRGGVLYDGYDTLTRKPVTLKVSAAAEGGLEGESRQRMEREVECGKVLCHPNVVQLLDFFHEGKSTVVFVLEKVIGTNLLQLLNTHENAMPEDQAAFFLFQILKGVLFMHDNGFCHRDLKLEHCIAERGTQTLKIQSFGLSNHVGNVRTIMVGSPDYMSPEVLGIQRRPTGSSAFGGPMYDGKAVDVWAIGVMLYTMLTKKYPFEDPHQPKNVSATLRNICAGNPRPLPPDVSDGCRDLIAAMLEPNPARRIKLDQIAQSQWLVEGAASHGAKIGRREMTLGSRSLRPTSAVSTSPSSCSSGGGGVASERGHRSRSVTPEAGRRTPVAERRSSQDQWKRSPEPDLRQLARSTSAHAGLRAAKGYLTSKLKRAFSCSLGDSGVL